MNCALSWSSYSLQMRWPAMRGRVRADGRHSARTRPPPRHHISPPPPVALSLAVIWVPPPTLPHCGLLPRVLWAPHPTHPVRPPHPHPLRYGHIHGGGVCTVQERQGDKESGN